jgi:SAM-dependent methyltransferase
MRSETLQIRALLTCALALANDPFLNAMKHTDHVFLLRDGIPAPPGVCTPRWVWADFGSGRGAFTLALADLLGQGSTIYSIDHSGSDLLEQQFELNQRFSGVSVHYLNQDFNSALALPPLDGIVMANALHFQRNKERTLQRVKGYLKPGGRFILVEYNADKGNPWVPYPLSMASWVSLAGRCGFVATSQLARVPSSFMGEIYSALSLVP